MNNSELLTKILAGLSKTLNVANRVIPIYQDTIPLIKNAKNIYSLFKDKSNNLASDNKNIKKIEHPKKDTIKVNDNNPQFFI